MEMTTMKTVAVVAIIFGCFAILYPKIFHPMVLHVLGFNRQDSSSGPDPFGAVPPNMRGAPMASPMRKEGRPEGGRGGAGPPHPGMRAADMKRQAASMQGQGGGKGGGGGLIGMVLPMYAVGIVIYLIYTLTKVVSKKDKGSENDEKCGRGRGDYLKDHFSSGWGAGGDPRSGKGGQTGGSSLKAQVLRQQQDLERLLLRADKDDISDIEMSELKRKLLETEAQMSRILKAMESVQSNIPDVSPDGDDDCSVRRNRSPDDLSTESDEDYDPDVAYDDNHYDNDNQDNEEQIENLGDTEGLRPSKGQTSRSLREGGRVHRRVNSRGEGAGPANRNSRSMAEELCAEDSRIGSKNSSKTENKDSSRYGNKNISKSERRRNNAANSKYDQRNSESDCDEPWTPHSDRIEDVSTTYGIQGEQQQRVENLNEDFSDDYDQNSDNSEKFDYEDDFEDKNEEEQRRKARIEDVSSTVDTLGEQHGKKKMGDKEKETGGDVRRRVARRRAK